MVSQQMELLELVTSNRTVNNIFSARFVKFQAALKVARVDFISCNNVAVHGVHF